MFIKFLDTTLGKTIFLAIVVSISVIVGLISIIYLGKDNFIEQTAEKIIKYETGSDINLSGKLP